MNPFTKRLSEAFQRTLAEVPWFGPVISAVLVAMLVNLLTDTLVAYIGTLFAWVILFVLVILIIMFFYAYDTGQRRRRHNLGPVKDLPHPACQRGLIFMFSNEATLREAIQYHQPRLEHCWLLVTQQTQAEADRLKGQFSGVNFDDVFIPGLYNTQACYQAVRDIYQREAPRLGFMPGEIVADITGGTKPMTVGMLLACMEGGYPIEHVPAQYDGKRVVGPLPPIEIRIRKL